MSPSARHIIFSAFFPKNFFCGADSESRTHVSAMARQHNSRYTIPACGCAKNNQHHCCVAYVMYPACVMQEHFTKKSPSGRAAGEGIVHCIAASGAAAVFVAAAAAAPLWLRRVARRLFSCMVFVWCWLRRGAGAAPLLQVAFCASPRLLPGRQPGLACRVCLCASLSLHPQISCRVRRSGGSSRG